MSAPATRKPVDKYIPWMFVLFFVVFIAVDAVMVTLAVRTQTGLVTEQAYEKGLAYNRALEAAAEQKNWGGTGIIKLEGKRLSFTLKDKEGLAIHDAEVTATVRRPVQAGYDATYPMARTGQQSYVADVEFPLPGEWDIRVSAKWQNRHYQTHETFIVQP
jgi:nitrogen fixation protein FixH